MPFTPRAGLPRCAVVDLGSNSVRLVVYEGLGRNPTSIFNEKAVLRLGRGLQATGLLDPDGMSQAMMILHRYRAVAHAMGANPIEVLATAAVRDARNGPDFVRQLQARMPDIPARVLSGVEEAELSSDGLLCGIPNADGLLADIGGGSLELVRINSGEKDAALTLPLGVIRLAEQSGGDPANARLIVEGAFRTIGWLSEIAGRDLYLVGGAWRALARIDMARTDYPLHMVHHYTIGRDEARELCARILGASSRDLAQMAGISRRRVEDLPFAAVVLRRLLRMSGARRVVFSASGLREGWLMRQLPSAVRAQDSLLAAGRDLAALYGRDPTLPPALLRWTAPLFPYETPDAARLREAACWMSDVGSHDHPEFRSEQAFLRILRQPGIGFDHPTRAFLALTIALRYEADSAAPFLAPVRRLIDPMTAKRAETLGIALRLAYTLSAGTPDLLAGTLLRVEGRRLVLRLAEDSGVFAGEAVVRRLTRLAQSLDLDPATETAPRSRAVSGGNVTENAAE
jgi:exopolyphosphatase / guanosine-5'-triphosphate,3'-diphosphate pyrophosphatase